MLLPFAQRALCVLLRAVPGCYEFFEVGAFNQRVFTYSYDLPVNVSVQE